jgi:apolipoprotein N-acyltransferase
VFRAVENGVTLVRATRWGWSAVVDACGHELACLDHFAASERILVAEVPVAARRTLYARIGDAWAWLCVAGLAGIVVRVTMLAP